MNGFAIGKRAGSVKRDEQSITEVT